MQRVSSLDAGMLYAETPQTPMHTMAVVILEPGSGPSPFEVMRRLLERRMPLLGPLRRRLVQGPLQIGDPHWIEDPEFDLENHLRHAALPGPGSLRELAEFVGDFASRLLERSKPLWEMALVEGLEGGRLAVVTKIHHAAMDGGRVVALLLGHLFDSAPEGSTSLPTGESRTPDREPSLAWFAADAARTLATRPFHAARAVADLASTIARGFRAERGDGEAAARLLEAPATPFNGALTRNRSVAFADVAFDDLAIIKRAFGTTINDVVVAAGCGAVRSWLLSHGGLPDRPLVVGMPVAVRSQGEGDAGNRISMILVHLPVQIEDAVERLMSIRAETRRARAEHGRVGGDLVQQFTDVVTSIAVPWLLTHAMELYSASHLADRLPPLWNLVISNLPGPRGPLYGGGARVLQIYPLGPVQLGSGLNLTVLSAADRLSLGVMACRELVPDVDDLANAFVDEIAGLRERANAWD